MKYTPLLLSAIRHLLPLLLVLGLSLPVLAHRLQVIAYPSGGKIVVEASVGNEQPVVRGSEVIVTRSVKGDVLLRGETDIQGRFSFPIPDLSANTSLLITVNSGQGHLGSRILTAEELKQIQLDVIDEENMSPPEEVQETGKSLLTIEERRLFDLVTQAVAREIEPLKHMLAKEVDPGPSMRDIIGGIGWLVGIGGLLVALKKK